MTGKHELHIDLNNGDSFSITIVADNPESIYRISKQEAQEKLEGEIQLTEGFGYEYEIHSKKYSIKAEGGVIKPSRLGNSTGRIVPNIYVGTLLVLVLDERSEKFGDFELEVRSLKADYRSEYQFMLEEITEKCTDLLMQYTSPVNQPFSIDHEHDSESLYQRFAFIKSVLNSEEFEVSVHRITSNPVTSWQESEEIRDIRSVRKLNRKVVQQFSSSSNRTTLPDRHALRNHGITSIPQKVIVYSKKDTVDNPENRFVKYALESFKNLCADFKNRSDSKYRLHKEASILEEQLDEYLSHSFFKEISRPDSLMLNSPILQRKEGYREVLRVWLMVNLAARITWKGGDDVYKGGKKDVATLYEYWLFFKLLDMIKELFQLPEFEPEEFIEETEDKLGLKLKQGRHLPIKGVFKTGNRKLQIQFSFNRTFSGKSSYPSGGSWTQKMRPDYTLSIWPAGIKEEQAEEEESIVHIHFDSKYKVDNLVNLFGSDDEIIDTEKEEQAKGNYKRTDLLKMHAYRDAIRRSAGAYILYPGNKAQDWRGYHEILPGLGAFNIKPNKENDGTTDLRNFLLDVIQHFLNRVSQREKKSYQDYRIYKSSHEDKVTEPLPELIGQNRSLIPDETFVLVGYSADKERLQWTLNNGLYNVRYKTGRGGVSLNQQSTGAKFLLLYGQENRNGEEVQSGSIYSLNNEGPRIYTSSELLEIGYPGQKRDYNYVVYNIENEVSELFNSVKWNIHQLLDYKNDRARIGTPIFVTLAELMKTMYVS